MLSAYLVATIGVPVQARIHKPGDKPFPCQHHACGCVTAEQCRDHCCCYTASERLVWARRHGVEMSATVVAEAAAEGRESDHGCTDGHAAPRSCCAHRAGDLADDGDVHAAHRHVAAACCEPNEPAIETRLIFSFTASKCRAISSLWCVTGAVILPPAVTWRFQWDVVERISPLAASLDLPDLSPPVPPPRV